MRTRAEAIPAWGWLTGLVAVSTLARFLVARSYPGPWIFQDEVAYSDLARSLGRTGALSIRGIPGTGGFGFLYSALVAPAYAAFGRIPDAYEAAKLINAFLMSLAAVPTYVLARRVAAAPYALLAALLAVAIPDVAYSSSMMTEVAFYPACVASMMAIALMLSRPTLVRQLAMFVPIAAACLIRAQAILFGPVVVTALVLVVLLETFEQRQDYMRRLWTRARAFWPTFAVLATVGVGVVVYERARGRHVTDILGAYSGLRSFTYSISATFRWGVYHLGDLDIALGVIPFAAFLLIAITALRPRGVDRELRIFAAVGAASVFWFVAAAGAYASNPVAHVIVERNVFEVMPMFLVAFCAWLGRGCPRPWPETAIAALVAAALPAALPFTLIIQTNIEGNAFGLIPILRAEQGFVSSLAIPELVVIAAMIGAAVFLLVPRRWLLVLPATVLVYFVLVHFPIIGITRADSQAAAAGGIHNPVRDWIDRAVGGDADVSSLFNAPNQVAFWENEFFNASVKRSFFLTSGPYDGLPQTQVVTDPATGLLKDTRGNPIRSPYLLTNLQVVPEGKLVASDPGIGMYVYRTPSPVRLRAEIGGMYADRWSGPTLDYTLYRCRRGVLTARVLGDPKLEPHRESIVASSHGRTVATKSFVPGRRPVPMRVPLRGGGGLCHVTFTVSPTAVPSQVLGTPDTRTLGVRFLSFTFRPR